ncbi:MAG: BatD family protein, partial [Bacteroidota bacterium]|nr:BatD family protein [Bacteroidota bacterium]
MGPSTSYNQSTSVINGKLSQNISYTYTYILQAVSEGKFTIPPAQVHVDGKSYESQPLKIEVVSGSSGESSGSAVTTSSPQGIGSEDLFVRLIVDKREIYQGDRITATIKIYSRVNLSGFEGVKYPDFAGFLRQDIETPPLQSLERESVKGQIYGTGVLSRFVLFPQKSGDLVIDPVEITALVQQRVSSQSSRSFFDDFFDSYKTLRKDVSSPVIKIKVKPLPAGSPPAFSGAVGSFRMAASLDKNTVFTNEAVTLRIKVSGQGNLKLIQSPGIDFPLDFESYDPKVTSNITSSMSGTSGSKTFEYLMIPRFAGKYRIPPVKLSYFDPAEGRYKTLNSGEFQIIVEKGENEEGLTMVSSPSKEDIRFIGKDIRFIQTGPVKLYLIGNTLWGKLWFFFLYIVFFLVFSLIYLFRKRKRMEQANVMLARNRKASKLARKRLKSASYYLKESNETALYEAILKALWGYLSDKFSIPASSLSRENITVNLEKYGIDKELIRAFSDLLNECEYAQYAPQGSGSEMKDAYEKAIQIIVKLEQKLR